MPNLFEELSWRGLVYHATDGLADLLATRRVTGYIGFDPTAPSLHAGSLLTVLGLVRLRHAGHQPIAVIGGGTGMIGDPSGKSQERVLLTAERVAENVSGIRRQLEQLLEAGPQEAAATIVDNAEWLAATDLISFLREAGKAFTVSYMLQKESVSRRMASEEGLSFTEFSYLVLQAYDFLQLHDRFGCVLQMGGSDQWGNITAGIDLIRRLRGSRVHGLVWPLMTTTSGAKFGKTEQGTVWLDAARTSPFRFYQFWLNTDDQQVGAYLRSFTFLGRDEIAALEASAAREPEKREAQRALARTVTALVHGPAQLARAERATELLFGEDITALPVEDVLAVLDDVPSTALPLAEIGPDGLGIVELVVRAGLAPSRSEARRLVLGGGVYVNNRRAADPQARIKRERAIGGRLFVIRRGQRQTHLLLLT